jgi:hypothetical protein
MLQEAGSRPRPVWKNIEKIISSPTRVPKLSSPDYAIPVPVFIYIYI